MAMQAPTWVLAVVVAAAAAGCEPYGSSVYDYGPSFERLAGPQPGYGYTSAYLSQWDYYRNYRGAVKPLPEKIQ